MIKRTLAPIKTPTAVIFTLFRVTLSTKNVDDVFEILVTYVESVTNISVAVSDPAYFDTHPFFSE